MCKIHVSTQLCLLYVLHVLGDEASQPKFNCASLCEQVDFGYAGICCGNIKEEENFKKNKMKYFQPD